MRPRFRSPVVGVQEARAHHRRQRERDEGRHDHRGGHGDGELAEQHAHHAAHQQQGDEHGDQRNGDRDDGEADLARALQCRVEGRIALLDVAHDVLDHDDGVVDDEADGDGHRHQGEVVDAVAQRIHHGEGGDQRQRHGDRGDDGRPEVPQEDQDDHDHQGDGQDQGELHVGDRRLDRQRAVGHQVDLQRGRQGGQDAGHRRPAPGRRSW